MNPPSVRICVPVRVERAADLPSAIKRASESADIIELRLDYLSDAEREAALRQVREYVAAAPRPLILTMRPIEQGGRLALDLTERSRLWSEVRDAGNCYLDLELDLLLQLTEDKATLDWGQIICSHHDFAGPPYYLEQIYEGMAATRAGILKIAVRGHDATDCIPIFRLLDRAQREGREMIAIAMGPAGVMTRILGPSRAAFLTYGSLDDENATAPGQLTAKALREVYRIDHINQQTQIFGLMGQPVGHSISPNVHNAAFAEAEVNAVYLPFEVHNAKQFLRRMAHPKSREMNWNLGGVSVTAPHKIAVMEGLNSIDPAAKEIGAVNTIVAQDNELHGYNTDAEGFISPLRNRFGSLRNVRCAIIGGGGAARAALWALRNEGARVTIFVRDPDKGKPVAQAFGFACQSLADARVDGFEIIVNATPLGTRGERESETPIAVENLRNVRLVYDLVYNPIETRFLREARSAGCQTVGGIEMLIAQAVEQFKLWIGKNPDREVMTTAALKALAPESKHQTSLI